MWVSEPLHNSTSCSSLPLLWDSCLEKPENHRFSWDPSPCFSGGNLTWPHPSPGKEQNPKRHWNPAVVIRDSVLDECQRGPQGSSCQIHHCISEDTEGQMTHSGRNSSLWHIWDHRQVFGLHMGSQTLWCPLRADVREGHGELLAYDETRTHNVWCSVIPDSVLTEMLKCTLTWCICVWGGSFTRGSCIPRRLGEAAQHSPALESRKRAASSSLDDGPSAPALRLDCACSSSTRKGWGHRKCSEGVDGTSARAEVCVAHSHVLGA